MRRGVNGLRALRRSSEVEQRPLWGMREKDRMKSARERAIDMYHAFIMQVGGPRMSRELLGLMIKEKINEAACGVVYIIEAEIEKDRAEIIAWSRKED